MLACTATGPEPTCSDELIDELLEHHAKDTIDQIALDRDLTYDALDASGCSTLAKKEYGCQRSYGNLCSSVLFHKYNYGV